MIGGTDIVFPASGDFADLEACAQLLNGYWPEARFENAITGEKYSYPIPRGQVRELLVYRDAAAESLWDAEATDTPPNTMIYLLLSPDSLTAVVDDPNTDEMRSILASFRQTLQMGTDKTPTLSPTAAADTTPRTRTC